MSRQINALECYAERLQFKTVRNQVPVIATADYFPQQIQIAQSRGQREIQTIADGSFVKK